jgi:hypothetical protein
MYIIGRIETFSAALGLCLGFEVLGRFRIPQTPQAEPKKPAGWSDTLGQHQLATFRFPLGVDWGSAQLRGSPGAGQEPTGHGLVAFWASPRDHSQLLGPTNVIKSGWPRSGHPDLVTCWGPQNGYGHTVGPKGDQPRPGRLLAGPFKIAPPARCIQVSSNDDG